MKKTKVGIAFSKISGMVISIEEEAMLLKDAVIYCKKETATKLTRSRILLAKLEDIQGKIADLRESIEAKDDKR